MNARIRLSLLLALVGGLLLAPSARAEDPPVFDVLAVLHLEPDEDAGSLASVDRLRCTVREGSPLTIFDPGDAVFLLRLRSGTFRVVPDTQGALACCVGETVDDRAFLSPRQALVALGLEPSDEPLAKGAHLRTRVVDRERLAAHGLSCDGVEDPVSIRISVTGTGAWMLGALHLSSSVKVDVRPYYEPRAPVGDALARASVVLDLGTLPEGGRLLARVAEPARLEHLGIRGMPAGDFVHLTRGSGSAWTLTTLSPGFTVAIVLPAIDPEAFVPAGLGLEPPRLLDLPGGGSVRGRLEYAWKAAQEGLKGARGRDRMEVVRREDGTYLLRDLEPRRPVSLVLEGP